MFWTGVILHYQGKSPTIACFLVSTILASTSMQHRSNGSILAFLAAPNGSITGPVLPFDAFGRIRQRGEWPPV